MQFQIWLPHPAPNTAGITWGEDRRPTGPGISQGTAGDQGRGLVEPPGRAFPPGYFGAERDILAARSGPVPCLHPSTGGMVEFPAAVERDGNGQIKVSRK